MKPQRVLIIEREKRNSDPLLAMFERERWVSQVATSASIALASAPRFRPTFVLFDLVAPTMDPTLFAALLRSSSGARVVIVGMTTVDSVQRQPVGIDDVFVKPVQLVDVVRTLMRV